MINTSLAAVFLTEGIGKRYDYERDNFLRYLRGAVVVHAVVLVRTCVARWHPVVELCALHCQTD